MKVVLFLVTCFATAVAAFSPTSTSCSKPNSALFGLFDGGKFSGFGTGANKSDLDEQWEAQQEILRNRRKPKAQRDAYFQDIERRRREESKKQDFKWGWQTKTYAKGEDPINEWRKQRELGNISDLEDQYGDPKKIGGIPLPMASFGVGGEFGVSLNFVCLFQTHTYPGRRKV